MDGGTQIQGQRPSLSTAFAFWSFLKTTWNHNITRESSHGYLGQTCHQDFLSSFSLQRYDVIALDRDDKEAPAKNLGPEE